MNQITDGVKHLIIINVIFFVGVYLPAFIGSPDSTIWLKENLSLYFPTSDMFQPWQLVTHMFMHGDLGHLIFNMLTLFFLGPLVEKTLGIEKFLVLYFTAGIAAMLLHLGMDLVPYLGFIDNLDADQLARANAEGIDILNDVKNKVKVNISSQQQWQYILHQNVPMLGASGAVNGVLVALAVLYPNLKMMLMFIPVPVKAKYMALAIVAYDVIFGIGQVGDGIAHYAHIGGAIAGFLLVYYWKKKGL